MFKVTTINNGSWSPTFNVGDTHDLAKAAMEWVISSRKEIQSKLTEQLLLDEEVLVVIE